MGRRQTANVVLWCLLGNNSPHGSSIPDGGDLFEKDQAEVGEKEEQEFKVSL